MFVMAEKTKAGVEKEVERRVMHLSFQNIESENSESADRLNSLNRELKVDSS